MTEEYSEDGHPVIEEAKDYFTDNISSFAYAFDLSEEEIIENNPKFITYSKAEEMKLPLDESSPYWYGQVSHPSWEEPKHIMAIKEENYEKPDFNHGDIGKLMGGWVLQAFGSIEEDPAVKKIFGRIGEHIAADANNASINLGSDFYMLENVDLIREVAEDVREEMGFGLDMNGEELLEMMYEVVKDEEMPLGLRLEIQDSLSSNRKYAAMRSVDHYRNEVIDVPMREVISWQDDILQWETEEVLDHFGVEQHELLLSERLAEV